jgi:hypothetical protein
VLRWNARSVECDSNICIFLICESIFFNHGSVLQQKDIKMLRENQRQILKIASIATSVDGPIATGAVSVTKCHPCRHLICIYWLCNPIIRDAIFPPPHPNKQNYSVLLFYNILQVSMQVQVIWKSVLRNGNGLNKIFI